MGSNPRNNPRDWHQTFSFGPHRGGLAPAGMSEKDYQAEVASEAGPTAQRFGRNPQEIITFAHQMVDQALRANAEYMFARTQVNNIINSMQAAGVGADPGQILHGLYPGATPEAMARHVQTWAGQTTDLEKVQAGADAQQLVAWSQRMGRQQSETRAGAATLARHARITGQDIYAGAPADQADAIQRQAVEAQTRSTLRLTEVMQKHLDLGGAGLFKVGMAGLTGSPADMGLAFRGAINNMMTEILPELGPMGLVAGGLMAGGGAVMAMAQSRAQAYQGIAGVETFPGMQMSPELTGVRPGFLQASGVPTATESYFQSRLAAIAAGQEPGTGNDIMSILAQRGVGFGQRMGGRSDVDNWQQGGTAAASLMQGTQVSLAAGQWLGLDPKVTADMAAFINVQGNVHFDDLARQLDRARVAAEDFRVGAQNLGQQLVEMTQGGVVPNIMGTAAAMGVMGPGINVAGAGVALANQPSSNWIQARYGLGFTSDQAMMDAIHDPKKMWGQLASILNTQPNMGGTAAIAEMDARAGFDIINTMGGDPQKRMDLVTQMLSGKISQQTFIDEESKMGADATKKLGTLTNPWDEVHKAVVDSGTKTVEILQHIKEVLEHIRNELQQGHPGVAARDAIMGVSHLFGGAGPNLADPTKNKGWLDAGERVGGDLINTLLWIGSAGPARLSLEALARATGDRGHYTAAGGAAGITQEAELASSLGALALGAQGAAAAGTMGERSELPGHPSNALYPANIARHLLQASGPQGTSFLNVYDALTREMALAQMGGGQPIPGMGGSTVAGTGLRVGLGQSGFGGSEPAWGPGRMAQGGVSTPRDLALITQQVLSLMRVAGQGAGFDFAAGVPIHGEASTSGRRGLTESLASLEGTLGRALVPAHAAGGGQETIALRLQGELDMMQGGQRAGTARIRPLTVRLRKISTGFGQDKSAYYTLDLPPGVGPGLA